MRYLLGAPAALGPAVLAASDFDGVAASHRRLVSRASQEAAARGCPAVAVVLWPGNDSESSALTSLDERLELLSDLGMLDHIAVAAVAGELEVHVADLLDTLDAWYDVRALVAFADRCAAGLGDALAGAATMRGWAVASVEREETEGLPEIARLVASGDVRQAAARLGHPFAVRGQVIAGDRRGRLLGFPTANLRPDPRKVLPANGVYAVRVRLPGEETAQHAGVANIGVRPTFGAGDAPLIEAHLLDVALDLYGLPIVVELVERIRAEQRFAGVEALQAQIAADAQRARALLGAAGHVPGGESDVPR